MTVSEAFFQHSGSIGGLKVFTFEFSDYRQQPWRRTFLTDHRACAFLLAVEYANRCGPQPVDSVRHVSDEQVVMDPELPDSDDLDGGSTSVTA